MCRMRQAAGCTLVSGFRAGKGVGKLTWDHERDNESNGTSSCRRDVW